MGNYNKGDVVEETAKYICVPCGFHHEYKEGDIFGECTSCLAGSSKGPKEYLDGTGIWEKELLTDTIK